jgi:hypothetical protein
MLRIAIIAAATMLLAGGTIAQGAVVTRTDDQGRTIRFAVSAANADVDAFATILRGAVHGPEIERVTIRVVAPTAIRRLCGRGAVACYAGTRRGGRITVPATSSRLAEILLHEYGHHLDAARPHSRQREPNGTRRWFQARRVAARLRSGALARDYSRGWSRSVAELFAEDYVQLHIRARWRLRAFKVPSAPVLAALRRDLTGSAVGPAPAPPAPVEIASSATLTPGDTRRVPFGLLGPGRRVEADLTVDGGGEPARVAMTIRCNGAAIGEATVTSEAPGRLDLPNQGPGECSVRLTGVAGTARYALTVRLSIPG